MSKCAKINAENWWHYFWFLHNNKIKLQSIANEICVIGIYAPANWFASARSSFERTQCVTVWSFLHIQKEKKTQQKKNQIDRNSALFESRKKKAHLDDSVFFFLFVSFSSGIVRCFSFYIARFFFFFLHICCALNELTFVLYLWLNQHIGKWNKIDLIMKKKQKQKLQVN